MSIFSKIYIVLSIIGIAVLAWIIYDMKEANKAISEELERNQEQIILSQQKARLYEEKSRADELFIQGEYKQALEIYQNIADSLGDDSFMETRFATIERLKGLNKTLDSTRAKGTFLLSEVRETMKYELEQQTDRHNQKMDSLISHYQGEISGLKSNIESLEKKLREVPKLEKLTFYNRNGTRIHYYGQVKNNLANGFGVAHFSTNSFYEGEWKNNMKHGEGNYQWVDGHRYEGEYVNDKREGEGTYFWNTGDRYEGEWKDDKRNGIGTLYDADNKIKLKGEWKDGEFVKAVN